MNRNIEFGNEKRHYPAFDIIGFTKIVQSGGKLYEETREDGRWEVLKTMNTRNKNIYGCASFDSECAPDSYRYTIGVAHDDNYSQNPLYSSQMFSLHVKESDWIVFTLDFATDYRLFWQNDPYKMIGDLGYNFNTAVGLHIDVYEATYNGHEMEFWMPVE